MARNHKREAERFTRDAEEAREDLQDLLVEAESRRRQFTELARTYERQVANLERVLGIRDAQVGGDGDRGESLT